MTALKWLETSDYSKLTDQELTDCYLYMYDGGSYAPIAVTMCILGMASFLGGHPFSRTLGAVLLFSPFAFYAVRKLFVRRKAKRFSRVEKIKRIEQMRADLANDVC